MRVSIRKTDGSDFEFDAKKDGRREDGHIVAEYLEHDRGGSVALFTNTGTPYHDDKATGGDVFRFDTVKVEGEHVPTAGSTSTVTGHTTSDVGPIPPGYIPNNPDHFRPSPRIPGSEGSHYLLGGEALPIFESPVRPPSDHEANIILAMLNARYDLEKLRHPRLMHLLRYFGWNVDRWWDDVGGRDLAWLTQNWGRRTGGEDKLGWYKAWQPAWGSGYSNNVYNTLFWVGLNYLIHRREADWHYGCGLILHHCALGRMHSGTQKGWMAYTKGPNFVGESYKPAWEKQFPEALYLWFYLTGGHPLIKRCLDDWHAVLSDETARYSLKPEFIWKDRYGSRRAARYLRSTHAAYEFTRDSDLKTFSENFIETVINPSPVPLPNETGHPSPWQDYQVARALEAWGEWNKSSQIKVDTRRLGTYELFGETVAAYRYDTNGPVIRNDSYSHHLAFMCGIGNPDLIGARIRDGFDIEPIEEMGIEDDRNGLGWPRTSAYILGGAVGLL